MKSDTGVSADIRGARALFLDFYLVKFLVNVHKSHKHLYIFFLTKTLMLSEINLQLQLHKGKRWIGKVIPCSAWQ